MAKKRNPVSVRGPWFAMPLDFLRSKACASLSPHALKMLLDLCSQLGPNASGNGDLSAAPAIMVPRGWASNATRTAALRALLDADLITITRHGSRRLCTLYAITLWPLQCDLSKLSVKPGAFSSASWTKGSKQLSEPPTDDLPAQWESLRKNTFSPPATGQPPSVMNPPRDNPRGSDAAFTPATGAIGPFSASRVVPPRDTFLDLPSGGALFVGAAAPETPTQRHARRPVLALVEGKS